MLKINIITIGTKAPDWVNKGYQEYSKRLSKFCSLNLIELPVAHRSKNTNTSNLKLAESKAIADKISNSDYVIALDVKGKDYSTEGLAKLIDKTSLEYSSIAIIIGGPDGLDYSAFNKVDHKLSLSKLTLPHPMVRIILAEQLYRVFTLLNNHPYHK